jgi:uncharacterized protein
VTPHSKAIISDDAPPAQVRGERPMRLLRILVIAALAAGSAPLAAQERIAPPFEPHISVAGEGTARVLPDLALVQAGVTTQGKTAREASEANGRAMASVIATLKEAGIAERDVLTAHFSIRPVYDTRRDGENRIVGFQASNQVIITVRAIPRLAALLDQIIAVGATDIAGIQFTVSERSRLLDAARAEAVADARRKAQQLAKAAGVQLGRAIAIVEDRGAIVPAERMMRTAAEAAVPIAPGEQTLRVHVNVTFELRP